MTKTAIIIGAGPAGLTAAYELLVHTDVVPIVLEKSGEIGGISRTTVYKGNRMDMGPHRFFSKSDRVMDWWLRMMPLEENASSEVKISYQNKSRNISRHGVAAKDPEKRMLLIQRLTRIYFLRKFFAYPIQLTLDTLKTLGLVRTIRIMLSFLYVRLFPRKPERSLEDFIINKFGNELYLLFFKDYTEKVWGVPCHEISAEWGAQRIKGVSLSKAIAGAVKSIVAKKKGADLGQKGTETSLIEQFLYPKYGPGSLWEEVARQVQAMGGKVYLHQDVTGIRQEQGRIGSVQTINSETGQRSDWEGDYFFSTMPVQELIKGMGENVPVKVKEVAAGLQYRDFINVGILLRQLSAPVNGEYQRLELKDNWIYIQERDVKVGRLMIYNNWGGGMIKDPNTTWIGMEYFCNKTDAFWAESDESIKKTAIAELQQMELARVEDVLDSTVARMEKTYPAYFGTYNEFDKIREYTDQFENLFLVGRNGMHKYNNADHSMLTAMVAVDNIKAGITSKANLWSINTEQEYHEEKKVPEVVSAMEKREPGFLKEYLWENKRSRAFWIFALVAFVIQLIVFKIRYPFANYMPDSYWYIDAASQNNDVSIWPVAYSKFLRQVSVFTHSDKILVGIQYLFLQLSSLFFLFSCQYFMPIRKVFRNILWVFVLFSPVPLYVSNYISADALFVGCSLCWISSLIWVIYRPRPYLILIHGVLLLVCFTLRYNAIFYPFIALLAFLLSRQSWRFKVLGIGFSVGLVLISWSYTTNRMQEVTGSRVFSSFGGWQLANNALYMYEHIPASQRTPVPDRFKKLDAIVRQHMDTLQRVKMTHEDSISGYFYLWNVKAPLIYYMQKQFEKDTTTTYFKKWASEGPLYGDYALYLIKKYPMEYAQAFMLPNAFKYALPPVEFLGIYNMGGDSVQPLAQQWFNYKTRKVQSNGKELKPILGVVWYPIFSALVNVLLLSALVGLLLIGGIRRKEYGLPQFLGLVVLLWIFNSGFSIFSSSIVLRYQIFPIFIFFTVSLLLVERIYKMI